MARNWLPPIVADAEAGFGGALNAFELMRSMIEAGAAGVHFEDQLASEKKCGHLGGKVLVPTSQFIRTLTAARLAADVLDAPTVLVARTDALGATLLTSDVDEYDSEFVTGERTSEGFFRVRDGIKAAISRGLAYAPYADVLWCETSTPDLDEAQAFAQAIHERFPGKLLAYNCSPSFNWRKHLDEQQVASFQEALADWGYRFQFITLAGFHSLNPLCSSSPAATRRITWPPTSICRNASSPWRGSATPRRAIRRRWDQLLRPRRDRDRPRQLDPRTQGLDRGGPVQERSSRMTAVGEAKLTASSLTTLSTEARAFVTRLQRELNPRRLELLERRRERQLELDAGALPDFLPETKHVRHGDWRVASAPNDLRDRRCEITGPVERKMMINALNSGARVFMADFEDANSPTWTNVLEGQANVRDAVRREIEVDTGEKRYRLNDETATLMIRPRGWHLPERHFEVDGEPISGSLFDFGLVFFHNARELIERGSGPYFYLPKLESHLEARLWAQAFALAEEELGIPIGSIRCTVLIETILAAFEMEEILYELRDYGCALNAGRWDYIFSCIKKFRTRDWLLPDRAQVTMTVPFMRAYTELLVRTCHHRGAHAIGGMAAFIPSRKDPEVNRVALAKVREDKERESSDGFDGTWVAHPDLVPVATEVFDGVLGQRPNQVERLRDDVVPDASALLSIPDTPGEITEQGLHTNVSVGVRYLDAWLHGVGAATIDNLMEDAATAEISRSQVWQWVRAGRFDAEQVRDKAAEVAAGQKAKELFLQLALADQLVEFLTLPAYDHLEDPR